ncbi:MAG: hypothetical protein Ct9H300mP32_4900 [Verrucomicrobiota bacterium]|nr:MAG: hypothetical protein Ct9H300mP32_4900 [Verrucomicrobiota bacterium]
MIPQLAQLLSPEEVQRIHEASLEILDQVGLEVNNPRAGSGSASMAAGSMMRPSE